MARTAKNKKNNEVVVVETLGKNPPNKKNAAPVTQTRSIRKNTNTRGDVTATTVYSDDSSESADESSSESEREKKKSKVSKAKAIKNANSTFVKCVVIKFIVPDCNHPLHETLDKKIDKIALTEIIGFGDEIDEKDVIY